MSDLHSALTTFIENRKLKATLAGFIRQGKEIEEIVVKWLELCTSYEDAVTQLQKKFGQVYKDINKKCIKGGCNIDLKYLYTRSVASGSAKREGLGLATKAVYEASKDIAMDLSYRKGSASNSATPNTAASNPAASNPAVSNTAASNAAVPNSAAPNSAASYSDVSISAAPDSATSYSDISSSAAPNSAASNTAASDTTASNAAASNTAAPNSAASYSDVSISAAPNSATSYFDISISAAPNSAASYSDVSISAPNSATSYSDISSSAAPNSAASNTAASNTAASDTTASNAAASNTAASDTTASNAAASNTAAPNSAASYSDVSISAAPNSATSYFDISISAAPNSAASYSDVSISAPNSATSYSDISSSVASNSAAASDSDISSSVASNSAAASYYAVSNSVASGFTVTPISTTEIKCKGYIENCREKSKIHGFNLQTDIQQVLGSMGIILLKENQLDQDLLNYVDAEKLAADIKESIMEESVKIEDSVFLELVSILRHVNKETNRRELKIQFDDLYKKASEEDGKIIEILTNLCMKLPNFERLETIGELELTTNFLDPVFFPLFNDPLKNKHFIWLNRQDKNSSNLRPDGTMVCIPKKAEIVTLGYCEVKATDSNLNLELAFVDLVRLASLSRNTMIRKENKRAITIQAVGYGAVIYFVEETFPGVTTMTEILSFNVPSTICGLGDLIVKLDQLKKISRIFHTQCQPSYKHPRPAPDDIIKVAINPKRRKSKTSSFSLV